MIIYECDRCGATSKEPMPHVTLAISKRGSDFSLPQDLAAKSPMLCQSCANELQRLLCEQLPRSAWDAEAAITTPPRGKK